VGGAILLLAGGWSFGITLAGVLDMPPLSAALAGFACLVAGALAPAGRVRLAARTLMAALLGAGWAAWQAAPLTFSGPLDRVAGDVVVRGRILDAPTPRGQRAETILLVDAVAAPDPPGEFQPIDPDTARVLLRAPALAATYDDRVEVRGHLARPRSRPGWPLTEILARRGIYWTLDAGSVRVLEVGGPSLRRGLTELRTFAEATTRKLLPEPHASLLAGMVFGARAGLPPDLRADLAATGTSHLTAVSGQNVALVAGALTVVGVVLLGRGPAALFGIVGVWLYTVLVGAPPSALRAAAMATVALAAQGLGRQPDTLAALMTATAALLAWDPGLAFDVGFQLSVTATAGLVLLSPPIEAWLTWLPRFVRGWVAVAVAAQLATLPIILGTFQRLSLISLPANVLAAPLVPSIMIVGALVALLGYLPLLDNVLGSVAWALTEALLIVIERSADVPGAFIALGRVPLWLPFVWYGLLLAWVAAGSADLRSLGLRPTLILSAVGAASLALVGWNVALAVSSDRSSQTVVAILDVEPSAAMVRTPAGQVVLLLTGEAGPGVVASAGKQLELWQHRLDVVIGRGSIRTDVDLLSLGQQHEAGSPTDGSATSTPAAALDAGAMLPSTSARCSTCSCRPMASPLPCQALANRVRAGPPLCLTFP
jgi:competence protein ComEC